MSAGAARARAASARLFAEACKRMPGGVNSPVRAFAAVGGEPFFVERGEGCRIFDVDGNAYIDYVGSWGPLILGHAHPAVVTAVQAAAARGTSFGTPTAGEVELAQEIQRRFPGMEKVRLVSSGTEATMSAIRLARGATARDGVVKCDGCYHGHVDALLVAAGSGAATLGVPSSAGVPDAVVDATHVVPFNDAAALAKILDECGKNIACFIVEPVAGNMGCVPPADGYLQDVRRLTEKHGVLLILDEVMTGFRVAAGGAQQRYGVAPDLTTLGKIVGGGLPVGAYGGRAELMAQIAPDGPVYQAGTLSGNPLAVAAGLATLRVLGGESAATASGSNARLRAGSGGGGAGETGGADQQTAAAGGQIDDPYAQLDRAAERLTRGLSAAADKAGVPVTINRVGSMFTVFFTAEPVTNFAGAKATDTDRFARYFRGMLERGIYLPPSAFEANFVSLAHTDDDIDRTVAAAEAVMQGLG